MPAQDQIVPPVAGAEEGNGERRVEIVELPWCPIVEFNAGTKLAEVLRHLPAAAREGVEALAQEAASALRGVVERAPVAALAAIEHALASLCTKPSEDAVQRGALNMINAGIYALCGDEEAGYVARRVDAFLQDSKVDYDPMKIRAIVREVRDCLVMSKDPSFAPVIPAYLLRALKKIDANVGERITESELENFLATYTVERARGGERKLSGIVADILIKGRMLGTTDQRTREDVVRRVDRALQVKENVFNSTS